MEKNTKVCSCPSGDGSLRWPCAIHATPSPAMGEELPPIPSHPSEERYSHYWSAAEEDAIRAYGRACMALRQPAAPAPTTLSDEHIHDIMSEHVNCDYKEGLAFARALLAAAGSSQEDTKDAALEEASKLCRRISAYFAGADVCGWVEVHSKLVAALAAKESNAKPE